MLVAADLDDLGAVSLLLAELPRDTYGQVYVEAPAGAPVAIPVAPLRMGVSRVVRPEGAEPGEALATAVAGWAAEWAPDEVDLDRAVTLWVGATARDRLAPVGAPLLPL